ncbi:MAG TPA: tetratricopeptide repeat protein [Candidatus Limnocylindria bacterium]|nr:tetratricopeptide repeat protein [Candidatus Limnocylindria bacterium]
MAIGNSIRSAMTADVGARIRSLRTARSLTQAQLAEPQYTKAYISMLESGRTRASMKALEHIAGRLGVQPSDLLGGSPSPAAPQFDLLEARRLVEQGDGSEAIPLLQALDEGLTARDQLVRLRYLAVAYNIVGQAKEAFPVIERAQRMAELLDDTDEKVRLKAVLAATYAKTYAYEDAVRLMRECVQACEDRVISDPTFHFRRLADLAIILTNQRRPKEAMPVYERAIELADQFSDRRSLGTMYAGLAKAHHLQGDVELAIRYNQRSLQVYEELSALDQVACTLDNIAVQYAEYGNRERARESLARGARIATEIRRETTLASIKTTDAEISAKADPAAAMDLAQEALKFARKVDQVDAQVRAMVLIGELKMKTSGTAARKSFQEARQLAEERTPHLLRMIFDRWSHAAEEAGDGDEALRLARRALESVKA